MLNKAVTYKTIGKHKVILGIGDAPPDPEESKTAIFAELAKTKEQAQLNKLVSDTQDILIEQGKISHTLKRSRFLASMPGGGDHGEESTALEIQWKDLERQRESLQLDMQVVAQAVEEKKLELSLLYTVYSVPRGAKLVTSAETDKILNKMISLNDGDLLTCDLKIVSASDIELERISALSNDALEAELKSEQNAVMSKSLQMRSELEIRGDEEALAKSQKFHAVEMKKLSEIYARSK